MNVTLNRSNPDQPESVRFSMVDQPCTGNQYGSRVESHSLRSGTSDRRHLNGQNTLGTARFLFGIGALMLVLILTGCGSSKSTPQDLGEAVNASDHERVQAILAEGVSPDITNPWGVTPLLAAVTEKDARMVKILLEGGADPNIAMQMGMTPIHHAVVMDMKEIVPLLLDAGVDPNVRDGFGSPTILYAVTGDGTILRRLIEAGADVNGADREGNTALHAIAMDVGARESNITILLEAGADPTLQNKEGKTALQVAEEKGREEVVELLRG